MTSRCSRTHRGHRCAATRATPPRARSAGRYRGDRPWAYRSGRGVFSTPVLGPDEAVYVGSADTSFYALDRDGERRWRFRTGGIIDAAATLGVRGTGGGFPITFGSGDETLYQLRRSSNRRLTRGERSRWKLPYRPRAGNGPARQLVGGKPRLRPRRKPLRRQHRRRRLLAHPRRRAALGRAARRTRSGRRRPSTRPATATGARSTSSPSRSIRPARCAGRPSPPATSPPRRRSGPTAPSTSGSFDRSLYALDPDTGAVRWSLSDRRPHLQLAGARRRRPTARPRRSTSARRTARYTRSAPTAPGSGAMTPASRCARRRCSGGRRAASGRIVYVGSSNGKLYALDAETGGGAGRSTPRPATAGSPTVTTSTARRRSGAAASTSAASTAGSGSSPTTSASSAATTVATQPRQEFRPDLARAFGGHPGRHDAARLDRQSVPASTVLAARLVVRRGGQTVDAESTRPSRRRRSSRSSPSFDVRDPALRRRPLPLHPPRRDPQAARPTTGSRSRASGPRTSDRQLRRHPATTHRALARRRRRDAPGQGADACGALELSRLALPLPSLLPSVNQIGFDSYDLIAGTIARERTDRRRGRVLIWVIGGAPRPRRRHRAPTPAAASPSRSSATYRRGSAGAQHRRRRACSSASAPCRCAASTSAARLGRRRQLRPRRQPLRPGHLRRRPQLLGPAPDRRRLQRDRHAGRLRDLPRRGLPARRRERAPRRCAAGDRR